MNVCENGQGLAGYVHADYAASLTEFGIVRKLRRSGGWILERPIPGFPYHDGMGCYPLFSCCDWSQLSWDIEDMEEKLVCLSLVADPFGVYNVADLRSCFKDAFFPFKQHYITDLRRPADDFMSAHHRRYAKKAFGQVDVERCSNPTEFVSEWVSLYSLLIRRHGVKGIAAFSESSLAKQLEVPGIEAFRATREGTTIGMLLWYVQGDVGYYHLGAYSEAGYALRASFALFSFSIGYFSDMGLRWLNLGAGEGLKDDDTDGLSRFKRGWSTGSRTAYFCGRILDPIAYEEVINKKGKHENDYFPAYRKGEFG